MVTRGSFLKTLLAAPFVAVAAKLGISNVKAESKTQMLAAYNESELVSARNFAQFATAKREVTLEIVSPDGKKRRMLAVTSWGDWHDYVETK
jgi:hypothetical protein